MAYTKLKKLLKNYAYSTKAVKKPEKIVISQ